MVESGVFIFGYISVLGSEVVVVVVFFFTLIYLYSFYSRLDERLRRLDDVIVS